LIRDQAKTGFANSSSTFGLPTGQQARQDVIERGASRRFPPRHGPVTGGGIRPEILAMCQTRTAAAGEVAKSGTGDEWQKTLGVSSRGLWPEQHSRPKSSTRLIPDSRHRASWTDWLVSCTTPTILRFFVLSWSEGPLYTPADRCPPESWRRDRQGTEVARPHPLAERACL